MFLQHVQTLASRKPLIVNILYGMYTANWYAAPVEYFPVGALSVISLSPLHYLIHPHRFRYYQISGAQWFFFFFFMTDKESSTGYAMWFLIVIYFIPVQKFLFIANYVNIV